MFLSKRPHGVYYIFYLDKDGLRKSISTKSKKKSEATLFLSNFSKDFIEKRNQIVIPTLLKSFCFEFLKHSESVHTDKTTRTFKTTFKYFKSYIGEVQLQELKEKQIINYIDSRIKDASIYQARKDLINLSSSFNWAIEQNYLLSNPCKNIKRLRTPEKLPIYYSKEDFNKLTNVINNKEFRALVIVAVNTGLRQMELLCLRKYQINMEGKCLTLDNQNHITKGKKIRTVPLNTTAINVISELLTDKDNMDYLFSFPGIANRWKYVQNNMRKYILQAGLNKKLNFHSLRHTFATWLIQNGVSIYVVSKLLGHSDIKTTMVYSHLRIDDLHSAVNQIQ